jgi:galactitol-specific phosphotransferase system IIB component
MAIVDIKAVVRLDTNVDFFAGPAGSPEHSGKAAAKALIDAGKVTVNYSLSSDTLTQTQTLTFEDLATYSAYDTALGIELDAMYSAYLTEHGFRFLTKDTTPRAFSSTGIDHPFTATNVYTFQANDPTMSIFASSISLDTDADITVGETTVTVVKQYANSADFSDNIFNDIKYARQLHDKGVTRTITYALVS